MDFAATVPIDMKLRGSTGKYLVRKAIEPWLPPGILDRPKQGFAVPLARWVRGDFGNYVESLWRDSRADEAGVLRPEPSPRSSRSTAPAAPTARSCSTRWRCSRCGGPSGPDRRLAPESPLAIRHQADGSV